MTAPFITMRKFLNHEWARVVAVVAALCLLALVPSLVAVAGGNWPFDDDAIALFGPWRQWSRQVLWSGVLPLWNPHLFLGMPFMSNGQTSILYLPNIIYWVAPVRGAMLLDAIFHSVLLGMGGYALARALHRTRGAAWLCALCLMLGSGVAAHLSAGHLTWHAARAYLPWILWSLIWFLRVRQPKYLFALAGFFALQVFAGYPPYVLWSVCWCVVFFAAWNWAEHTSPVVALRPFCSRAALLSGVLLILLSAAIVLPLRETSAQSTHGAEIPFESAVSPSSHLSGWVRLALPNFFGGNKGAQWSIERFPHEEAAYIGLLPFGLAWLSPLLWRWNRNVARGESRFDVNRLEVGRLDAGRFAGALWLLLPMALVLALGDHTPLYRWLYDALPPLRMFRVPARWFEIWYFAACVLAAFGWDAAVQLPAARKKTIIAGMAIFAILLLVLGAAINFWPAQSSLWVETAQWNKRTLRVDFHERLEYATYLKSVALQSVALALGVLLVALILLMRARNAAPPSKESWRRSILVLVACDLLLVFWSCARFARDGWPKNPWPQGIGNYYRDGQRWNTLFEAEAYGYGLDQGLPLEIDLLGGYDALASKDFFRLAGAIESRSRWSSQYQASRLDPLLQVAAVTHVFTSSHSSLLPSLLQVGAQPIATFGSGKAQMQLWQLPRAWPRAFLTSHLVRVPREEQLAFLHAMAAGSTPGAVTDESAFPDVRQPRDTNESRLQWKRGNNFSAFEVQSSRPQILVQSDALFPGWRAWVNGRPAKIERVNFLFRGVLVPAGNSRAVFVYDTQTYRFAIFLSLLGLGVAAGVLGFLAVSRRRSSVR